MDRPHELLNGSGLSKRVLDLSLIVLCLPIWAAVMLIGILAVKIFSRGSIFFLQDRYGKDWTKFKVIKFRTMVPNAENLGAGIYTEQNDPRYTRIGLILRKTSIDELPQILNVIKGEMSIIGPRPMLPQIVKQYRDEYREILKVKPGITGLAQVSGRNELPRSKRLELDIWYARNRTLLLDLRILVKTLAVLINGKGQCNYQGPDEVER